MKPTKILFGILMATTLTQNAISSQMPIPLNNYIKSGSKSNLIQVQAPDQIKDAVRQPIKSIYFRNEQNIDVDKNLLPKVPLDKELLFILGVSKALSDNEQQFGFKTFFEIWKQNVNFKKLNLALLKSYIDLKEKFSKEGQLLSDASKFYDKANLTQKVNYHYYSSYAELDKTYYAGLIILRDKQTANEAPFEYPQINIQNLPLTRSITPTSKLQIQTQLNCKKK